MQTVQNEKDKKLGFNFEFEAESDKNNTFSIILNADTYSFLQIKATRKNDLFKKCFSSQILVDKIKENKYFLMFDDLKEICNEISERIKKKEMKLEENLDGLNLFIYLPSTKIKEIKFELKEEQKNDKDKINDLNELIMKLHEEINEIRIKNSKDINDIKNNHNKEINDGKREINELKNIVNNQNNEINEMKKKINFLTDLIKIKDNIPELKDSRIINNNIEYIISIKNWINPNVKIKCELLYRMSRDGDKISKFHELCDNKGPTLTLFETIDGNKGGIYTPLSWDINTNDWKDDLETFLFDLNKNKKYKKIKKEKSIFCRNDHGAWISVFGFYKIHQMRKIQHGGTSINNYYENGAECLSNNSTNFKYFDVKEVEVYKIIL